MRWQKRARIEALLEAAPLEWWRQAAGNVVGYT